MAAVYTTVVDGTTFGFDWVNQYIETDSNTNAISAEDLKTAIHRAQAYEIDGIVNTQISDFGNPVVLTDTTSTFLNVVLLEEWRILTLALGGTFTVGEGNTVNINNGIDIFAPNPQVTSINNTSSAGVLVETGVSGLTPTESALLASIVNLATLAGQTVTQNAIADVPTAVWDEVL